jgi:hypothetical protein
LVDVHVVDEYVMSSGKHESLMQEAKGVLSSSNSSTSRRVECLISGQNPRRV